MRAALATRAAWVLLMLCVGAGTAQAQCADGNGQVSSILEAANAARQLTDDWAALRQRLEWDQSQLVESYQGAGEDSPRFASGLSLHFQSRALRGFSLCRSGSPLPTDLQNLAAALVWTFDDTQADWGVRGYLFLPATGFFHRTQTPEGGQRSVEQLGYSQELVLGELRWKDRFTLGAGYLTPLRRSAAAGVPAPPAATVTGGRPVLALSAPFAHLYSLFLLGERFLGLERLDLGAAQVPLPVAGLDVGAAVHHVQVERQWFVSATGGWSVPAERVLRPRLEAEVAAELDAPRLRSARLSASAALVDRGFYGFEPLGPAWVRLVALADGTVFNSRYLETQAQVQNAWGWHVGGELQLGVPMGALVLGAGVGRNRPASLAAFPAAVHRTEQWVTFGLRVAPWAPLGWRVKRGQH